MPRMNDWLLPDDLPPGRLIAPDPSYARAPAGGPVLWVSDAPVAQPAGWWVRLRAGHERTGLWPLVLETLDGEPSRPWHDGELDPGRDADRGPDDVERVLEALWEGAQPADEKAEDVAMVRGPWPGLAPPGEAVDEPDAFAEQVIREWFDDPALIGLVPAPHGAAALRACGWQGPINHATTADVAAVLGSWQDRFGVRLLGVGFDTISVSVAAPPRTADHAMAIAAEHYAFCPDNLWQGPYATLPEYAQALVDAPNWFFWWD
jgi:Domain of unknown function (DUF4253)